MDLRAMAVVTAAITAERLTPAGQQVARGIGAEILDAWQNTADRAAAGNLDYARIREVVLETVERVTGKRPDSPTVSEWLERWVRIERGAVAGRTNTRLSLKIRRSHSRALVCLERPNRFIDNRGDIDSEIALAKALCP